MTNAKSAEAPTVAPRRPSAPWGLLGFALVAVLCSGYVLLHARVTDRQLARLSADNDPLRGTDLGPSPVILRHMAYDGYLWVRHADHLKQDGHARLRHTDFDNAPDGREVHWNSAFAWYLRLLGQWRRAIVPGESQRAAIARMSIWANPILLALFLPWFSWLIARRFGPAAGTITALSLVCSTTFYEGFYPAYPDHHGLISAAILGCIYGIAWAGAGWIAPAGDGFLPRDVATARRGMQLSALFGAAGLWFSAISQSIAMVGIGLGALAAAFFFARSSEEQGCEYHPDLWRHWGRVGALAALAFYLLEYFPSLPRLRLEVNHPLFALAWWAGGECLALFGEWLAGGRRRGFAFPVLRALPWLIALAIIPLTVLIFGEWVHAARGEFLAAIHTHISEFKPLLWRIYSDTMTWSAAFGPFPVFVLGAAALLMAPRVPAGIKSVLAFALSPVLFITAMHFHQIRWGTLGGSAHIVLGMLVLVPTWRWLGAKPRWRVARWLPAIALALWFVQAPRRGVREDFRGFWAPKEPVRAHSLEALHLVMRDIAATIRRSAGDRPVVLLSSPNSSLLLGAMGDFQTIGTLYWENATGLKAAARMFAAQSDDEALRLFQERGVTHVALISWENFIEPYVRIINPEGGDAAVLNSFGFKALYRRTLPIWCRPLPYPTHDALRQLNMTVLLLQVVPEQTPLEAFFHVGVYHRAEGRLDEAEKMFREVVNASPDSNLARMELAGVLLDTGRFEEGVREMIRGLGPVEGPAREGLLLRIGARLAQVARQTEALTVLEAFPLDLEKGGAGRANLIAWLRATAADERLRDPQRSLAILVEIERAGQSRTVPWSDTQAASLAALGRFEEAVAELERHIAGLAPDVVPEARALLERRLARYRERRPWIEPDPASAAPPPAPVPPAPPAPPAIPSIPAIPSLPSP